MAAPRPGGSGVARVGANGDRRTAGVWCQFVRLATVRRQCPAQRLERRRDGAHREHRRWPLQRLFRVSVPGVADGAPAYLSGVGTPAGPQRSRVHHHPGRPDRGAGRAHRQPRSGRTPTRRVLSRQQQLHRLLHHILAGLDPQSPVSSTAMGSTARCTSTPVGDGTEITGGGWPETATLKGFDEKGSSALSIATAANGASYPVRGQRRLPGRRWRLSGPRHRHQPCQRHQHVFNTALQRSVDPFRGRHTRPARHCAAAADGRLGAAWRGLRCRTPTGSILPPATAPSTPRATTGATACFALHPDGTGAGGNPLDSYTPQQLPGLQNRRHRISAVLRRRSCPRPPAAPWRTWRCRAARTPSCGCSTWTT